MFRHRRIPEYEQLGDLPEDSTEGPLQEECREGAQLQLAEVKRAAAAAAGSNDV